MLVSYNRDAGNATIVDSIVNVEKMRELLNLFGDVPLDSIRRMLSSDAGRLARSILIDNADTVAIKALIDELTNEYISADTNRKFVSRDAMLAELQDILNCKSITPYRRSRINKALKRECMKCHGSGKTPRAKTVGGTGFGTRPVIKHEIDSRSPDCEHCKGSGVNPSEIVITMGEVKITKEELKGLKDVKLDEV